MGPEKIEEGRRLFRVKACAGEGDGQGRRQEAQGGGLPPNRHCWPERHSKPPSVRNPRNHRNQAWSWWGTGGENQSGPQGHPARWLFCLIPQRRAAAAPTSHSPKPRRPTTTTSPLPHCAVAWPRREIDKLRIDKDRKGSPLNRSTSTQGSWIKINRAAKGRTKLPRQAA